MKVILRLDFTFTGEPTVIPGVRGKAVQQCHGSKLNIISTLKTLHFKIRTQTILFICVNRRKPPRQVRKL